MITKNFKKAFTLAEVLIVLTILGVIATISMTTLKPSEFKERALKVAAKKTLNDIDQATTQIMLNDSVDGKFTNLYAPDGTVFKTTEAGTDAINFTYLAQLYKKYLTVTRQTCTGAAKEGVTDEISAQATGLSDVWDGCPCSFWDAEAFYLKSGACVGLGVGESDASFITIFPGEESITTEAKRTHVVLIFDTNGEDGPNVLGKDQFSFFIDENGIKYSD